MALSRIYPFPDRIKDEGNHVKIPDIPISDSMRKTKQPYCLVYTTNYCYLYSGYKEASKLVYIEKSQNISNIVATLQSLKISLLSVFEYTSEQSFKVENCSASLRLVHFLQWYWQKKITAVKVFDYGALKIVAKKREILSIGILPSSQICQLLSNISVKRKMHSGFFEQGNILFSVLSQLKPSYKQKLLLIAIDQESNMSQWLFNKGSLLFWRCWSPSLKENMDNQILPAVSSLIKYLDKIVDTEKMEIAFVTEKQRDIDFIAKEFENSSVFQPDDISTIMERSGMAMPSYIRLFHGILLASNYKVTTLANKNDFRLDAYIRRTFQTISAAFLIASSMLCYNCIEICARNSDIKKEIDGLSQEVFRLRSKIDSMPFSIEHSKIIQAAMKNETVQQARLWKTLQLISSALSDAHLLIELSIGPETLSMSIVPVSFQIEQFPIYENFLDALQKIFKDTQYKIISNPDDGHMIEAVGTKKGVPQPGAPMIIEIASPLKDTP